MLPLSSRAIRLVRSAILPVVRRRTLLAALGFTLPAALGITVAARARGVARRAMAISDTFSPASGTHFTSASQNATVNACDDTYDITSMTATLNGSSIPVGDGLLASCPPGSPGKDKGALFVTLVPGSNDVGVEICNTNGDCTSDDATYYFDTTAIAVTARVHADSLRVPGGGVSFWVSNRGSADTVDWSGSCTAGVTCTGAGSIALAARDSVIESVSVHATSAVTATITLSAHDHNHPTVSASDTTRVRMYFSPPQVFGPRGYSPVITPTRTDTVKFTVLVPASAAGTYALTPSCSGLPSCTVTPSTLRLPASNDTARVIFFAPYRSANTCFNLSLTASGPGTGSGSYTACAGNFPVTSIFVDFDAPGVNVGQGTHAHATIVYADGSTNPNATVKWSTGNSGVATVDSTTGAVTGAGAGSTSITATVSGHSGSGTIPVASAPATGLQVTMQRLNAEGSVSRDACLTIAAGDDAAYECGDLRLVHPMPAVRTMNESRAPMLIYNSRHSRPVALVAANVTGFSMAPSTITASLNVGGYTLSRTYSWNSSCNNATCRIVVPIPADSLSLATGWYVDTLQVSATSGGTPYTASAVGSVAIVNRTTSPFGAGWWVDGVEELVPVPGDTTKMFWVAGNGDTRLYQQTAVGTVFTATPVVDRPDSLVRNGTNWERHLRNGAFVEFNSSYQHELSWVP